MKEETQRKRAVGIDLLDKNYNCLYANAFSSLPRARSAVKELLKEPKYKAVEFINFRFYRDRLEEGK